MSNKVGMRLKAVIREFLRAREGRRCSEVDEEPEATSIFALRKGVALLRAVTSRCCEVDVAV